MKLTLSKYILTEMVPIFVSSLLVFGFIMLGTRMLSVTELVMDQGVGPGQVVRLVFFLIPGIVFFALPASSLMASLLAFIRLSSDNEVIALKSSGISLYQLLPPVILLSLAAFVLASLTALVGLPWGNRSLKDMVFEIAQSKADVGLKERVFSQPFDDVIFYVSDLSAGDRVMKDVFVVDKREKSMTYTIIASEGRMIMEPESRTIVVRFMGGTIFVEQKDARSVKTVQFRSYDLKVDLEDILESLAMAEKAPKEMGLEEILGRLSRLPAGSEKRNEILLELLERITLPVAVFLLGIIGVPLGTHMKARAFSFGIVVSLAVFLMYYVIFMTVRGLCETGKLAPETGMWLPNAFLAFLCVYFWRRVANEKPLPLSPEGFLRRKLSGFSRPSGKEPPPPKVPRPAPSPKADNRPEASPSKDPRPEPPPEVDTRPEFPPYVGNIRLKRFHSSSCRFIARMATNNKCGFSSREEAVEAGYEPCGVCKP